MVGKVIASEQPRVLESGADGGACDEVERDSEDARNPLEPNFQVYAAPRDEGSHRLFDRQGSRKEIPILERRQIAQGRGVHGLRTRAEVGPNDTFQSQETISDQRKKKAVFGGQGLEGQLRSELAHREQVLAFKVDPRSREDGEIDVAEFRGEG